MLSAVINYTIPFDILLFRFSPETANEWGNRKPLFVVVRRKKKQTRGFAATSRHHWPVLNTDSRHDKRMHLRRCIQRTEPGCVRNHNLHHLTKIQRTSFGNFLFGFQINQEFTRTKFLPTYHIRWNLDRLLNSQTLHKESRNCELFGSDTCRNIIDAERHSCFRKCKIFFE